MPLLGTPFPEDEAQEPLALFAGAMYSNVFCCLITCSSLQPLSSREILVVQALSEDEYTCQSMCPIILPEPVGRLIVLHLDIGTGPLGLLPGSP